MKAVHIVGHQGCGKTTLMVDLIKELANEGYEVGTLKHSTHDHELDKKGKDSHRHRTAGAALSSIMTANMTALYLPRKADDSPKSLIEKYYQNIDILLIEGWIKGPFNKIETWSVAVKKDPLYFNIKKVACIVSQEMPTLEKRIEKEKEKPVLIQRNNIKEITNFILSLPDV